MAIEVPLVSSAPLAPLDQEVAVLRRLQCGERPALATLYEWYGQRLYYEAILPRLPNVELSEDVLKDTFRIAMERIDQFEPRGVSVYFWLRRIAINLAMDQHRADDRQKRLTSAVRNEPDRTFGKVPQPDDNLHVEETATLVHRSLDLLAAVNARYAQALQLRLIEEHSREECATHMGVTTGNFDVILHRACKAFRKVFPP